MLCSICKTNTAVIFINKRDENGKADVEGLCYECAKKKGINPIDAMAKQAQEEQARQKQAAMEAAERSEQLAEQKRLEKQKKREEAQKQKQGSHMYVMP